MGTPVAERLLEDSLAEGAVLMAPVPTCGTSVSVFNMSLSHPQFFSEIANITRGDFTPENLVLFRDVYFSPDMPPEQLTQFAGLIGPGSQRAITEMVLWGWRFVWSRPRLPVLTIGGECDVVFPPCLLESVARRWNCLLYTSRCG